MYETLREKTACLVLWLFWIITACIFAASVAVCCFGRLYDTVGSAWRTVGYSAFYGVLTAVFYRFGSGKQRTLPILLAVCFLLRLFFVVGIHVEPFSDFRMYHTMAASLAEGKRLCSEYGALFPHTIGFSAVVSVLYRWLGANPLIVQIGNVVVETATAVLLFGIASEVCGQRIGHLVVFLYTVSPSLILYSELLATEILFTFLFVLLLYLVVWHEKKGSLWYSAAFGAVAACSHAIRPNGLLLLAGFALFVCCISRQRRRAAAVLLALMCFFGGWFGIYQGLSFLNARPVAKAPVGYNLYIGSNLSSSGKWNPQDYQYAMKLLYGDGLSPDEVHDRLGQEGWQRYREHGFAKNAALMVHKFVTLWGSNMLVCDFLNRSSDFSKIDQILHTKNMTNGFHLLLAAAVFLGAIQLIRQKRRNGVLYSCIFVLGLTCQHLIAEVQERYSYTAWAVMLLIAALGMYLSMEKGGKWFVQTTSGRYPRGHRKRPGLS